jgi:hypothetical protein
MAKKIEIKFESLAELLALREQTGIETAPKLIELFKYMERAMQTSYDMYIRVKEHQETIDFKTAFLEAFAVLHGRGDPHSMYAADTMDDHGVLWFMQQAIREQIEMTRQMDASLKDMAAEIDRMNAAAGRSAAKKSKRSA